MTNQNQFWFAYTDGASRGNPGPAGCGVWLVAPSGDTHALRRFLEGDQTNNQAEYEAMLLALRGLLDLDAKCAIIRADSELMVKQMNGVYRIKHPNIIPLAEKARQLIKAFEVVKFEHVPREQNKDADRLANEAIDLGGPK